MGRSRAVSALRDGGKVSQDIVRLDALCGFPPFLPALSRLPIAAELVLLLEI